MVLFLDIDGVLNQLQRNFYLDDKCIENLAILCKKYNCDIVLTSTWRLGYSYDFDKCTPQVQNLITKLKKNGLSVRNCTKKGFNRSGEIKDYVKHYEVSNYIILDDDAHLFSDNKNLYLVNPKTGLTKADIKKIDKFIRKVK